MKILDTRDLYKRQQELQEEYDDLIEMANDAEDALRDCEDEEDPEGLIEELADAKEALTAWVNDNMDELEELNYLESEIGREWMHGVALIPSDDFEGYARELAEDLYGNELRDSNWPFNCIDWEQATNELEMDYSMVTYDGEDYLFRS